ncbi:MAG: hypothetical protein QG622_349 [Actinomycetota bacterium]|nr:hypothetical protein [Actinomycetota bacterium]
MYLDLDAEQLRSRLLRPLWQDAVDVWRDIDAIRNVPAARRLLDAGADPADLSVAMRAAALDAVFTALSRIDDDGRDPAASSDGGWRLVRTAPDGTPTGHGLGRLSEELLAQDPSGRAGVDLRR